MRFYGHWAQNRLFEITDVVDSQPQSLNDWLGSINQYFGILTR